LALALYCWMRWGRQALVCRVMLPNYGYPQSTPLSAAAPCKAFSLDGQAVHCVALNSGHSQYINLVLYRTKRIATTATATATATTNFNISGNGEGGIAKKKAALLFLKNLGCDVVMFEHAFTTRSSYRSVDEYLSVCNSALQAAVDLFHLDTERTILFGRSAGCIGASYLAHKYVFRTVVLQSGFASLYDVARARSVRVIAGSSIVSRTLRLVVHGIFYVLFHEISAAPLVSTTKTIILWSNEDRVVPPECTKRLMYNTGNNNNNNSNNPNNSSLVVLHEIHGSHRYPKMNADAFKELCGL
jgi:hypothetical protein